MTRRRERPLPKLPINLEMLPPPITETRDKHFRLRFTADELAMIETYAQPRGEPPSVFCRTIVLTALETSALRALAEKRDLLNMSPIEQQRALLEAFSFEDQPPPFPKKLPREKHRDKFVLIRFTKAEHAMIEKIAEARQEQPSVLLRTIVLTAIQNSASRVPGQKRDVLEMSPIEQQKALLEAFSFED